ncbi:MAG: Periplasmic protease [Ignavibacteria bacterium]|nr:Periplasmic protease [Ignavibacteria bacterium]
MLRILIITTFLLLISEVKLINAQEHSETDKKILFQTQKFKNILETASINSLDSFDIEKVCDAAYNSLLREIDPFGSYNPPEKQKNVDDRSRGATEGIGIDFVPLSDTATVISVFIGSPADSAGILTGDKILYVNGENAVGKTKPELAAKISGEKGTSVTLVIKRGWTSTLQEFIIKRLDVALPSFDASFLIAGTKIGYIKCTRFSDVSHPEFVKLKDKLKGAKQLIIDVRGNPGGSLEEVVKIADEFIPEGCKLTYTSSRNPIYVHEYKSSAGGIFERFPVIIIIDALSSSGSEALAGAVQDLDRGIVVGEQSYGKGLAQSQWKMTDGSGFRLTVAQYYTPSGRCIQKPYHGEKPVLDPSLLLNTSAGMQKILEEIYQKTGGKTQLPIFHTSLGKPVIGGGGIYPDYFEKKDTTTLLTRVLYQKGIFMELAFNFLYVNRKEISEEYENDFAAFSEKFRIDDSMLVNLKKLSFSKNIWNDEMFVQDKEIIRIEIKASIAFALWGNNGFEYCMMPLDKPIMRSIELMPEAEKMMK